MHDFPPNHFERHLLADEVHARPPQRLTAPVRASYVAVLVDAGDRAAERLHLAKLFRNAGAEAPHATATHCSVQLGAVRLKWERHGEFSGYLVTTEGASSAPFAEAAASLLPRDWLSAVPGRTVAAVHVEMLRANAGQAVQPLLRREALLPHFEGHEVVGAQIAEGAASVYTDFRMHADGFTRCLVLDRAGGEGLTEGQTGRTLQRLVEIEAYRMLSLLALPMARRMLPRLLEIEKSLATITDGLAQGPGDDEAILHELTRLAAEVESGLAASQFRFGACRAYFELVMRRVAELRETRQPGLQTIEEFMSRRFTPAVATCNTAAQRLQELSERIARASKLLSTRVDITRERQNQALLASMDRRAKTQLRLQQTVEGLSVAAIVYYLAGLVGYLAKGLKAAGWPVPQPDLVVGLAVPLLAAAALLVLRRARQHALKDEEAGPPAASTSP